MEINCIFYTVRYINIYSCIIREPKIIDNIDEIKEFKGNHEEGKSHNDVDRVCFDQSDLNYFPRGLQKHFPNLIHLRIYGGGIKEITKSDLKGLERLENLWIDKCELSSLPDDLLTEMPNLRDVSFGDNQIEFASSELLKPLIGREYVRVYLEGNKRIDAFYMPGIQGSLKSLEDLMKLIDEKCIKPIVVPNSVDSDLTVKDMSVYGNFSDLTIIAGEKKFKVHKNNLGMKNEVFAEIFNENEATEIKIPGISSDAVKALLKFIHTNDISKDGNTKGNLEIAIKFKVADVKSFYEKIFFEQLDDSNALEIFLFAHRHSSQLLMEKAFHLIAEKFPELPIKLLEDPEKLKKLIDARRDLDELLEDK